MTSTDPSGELLAKYKKALRHAKIGLWEIDFISQIFSFDDGVRTLYDILEERYSGPFENWLLRIHQDDRQRVRTEFESFRKDLTEMDTLFRVATGDHRDQAEKYIRANAVKVRNNKNEVIGLLGMTWDVTNEHRLQEELKKSKLFLEKVIDAIPDPVFIKNSEHRTIFTNKEFEKLAGKTKSELINRFDVDFVPRHMAELYWQQDETIFVHDESRDFEEVIIDASGVERNLFTKKTSLQISPQEKVLVGVIRDITEIRKMQSSLIEQSKMASLGEMAAEIAHEINNPLMIIQAKAQILQERLLRNYQKIDEVKLKIDLQSIENNSVRIDKIIKSLKSVSRKADGDPYDDVSIRKIVDEALEISKERLNKSEVLFSFLLDEIIDYNYMVRARNSEIVQVLVNLLNNSFDAVRGTEAPWIRVNLFLVGAQFNIEIIDSGNKIPAEVAKKMMEPFFTTKTAGAGTGLGLSVSKQIIEHHSGQLFYDPSSEDTKFVIHLKRSESVSKL